MSDVSDIAISVDMSDVSYIAISVDMSDVSYIAISVVNSGRHVDQDWIHFRANC